MRPLTRAPHFYVPVARSTLVDFRSQPENAGSLPTLSMAVSNPAIAFASFTAESKLGAKILRVRGLNVIKMFALGS